MGNSPQGEARTDEAVCALVSTIIDATIHSLVGGLNSGLCQARGIFSLFSSVFLYTYYIRVLCIETSAPIRQHLIRDNNCTRVRAHRHSHGELIRTKSIP